MIDETNLAQCFCIDEAVELLHVSAYNLYVICACVYGVTALRANVAVYAAIHLEFGFNCLFAVFTFCKHSLYPIHTICLA